MENPLLLALTDDHAIMRKGLKELIEKLGNYKVMMEANSGEDLLLQLSTAELLPEICFLDISMPGIGGVETLKLLQKDYPSIYVIVCTVFSDITLINEVMYIGAQGFLCKNCGYKEMQMTITQVSEKRKKGLKEMMDKPETYYPNLFEIELLKLLCLDLKVKQIASRLDISIGSVNGHIRDLNKKLKLHNRASLVSFAHRIGLFV